MQKLTTMAKRIAVIGSGASGLTAIKCCLDEDLEPVCFERTDNIGGLWHYTEDVRTDTACVMRSTVINTSKEMMCFSDFPIAKENPIFMHNKQVYEYFNQYAEAFGLRKHIRFETEVLSVKMATDFEQTGKWDLEIKTPNSTNTEKLVFDGVLVCTGHHATKNEPSFSGLEDFEGVVIHSHDYRHYHDFENKRVVIIGIGNSGGDAAVELSTVASQVYISTRRGTWVLNRLAEKGLPADMTIATRFSNWILKILPISVINCLFIQHLNNRFDHTAFALRPEHSPTAQHPMVNEDLPNRIISGSIKIKTDVKNFTKNGVEFVDGTKEDNIDVVFMATGYIFGFPFLDKSVVNVKENRVELFKYVFPPDLAKPTLAIIGCIQPIGSTIPISELQCRLATRVFKGDVRLPLPSEMWRDIRDKEVKMMQRYVKSQRHTIQVDYIPFMDELAELNGCQINIKDMLMTDPKLALKCFFGSCSPYQYRLVGPGKWAKAREALFSQWERTMFPLKTRPVKEDTPSPVKFYIFVAAFILLLAYFIIL